MVVRMGISSEPARAEGGTAKDTEKHKNDDIVKIRLPKPPNIRFPRLKKRVSSRVVREENSDSGHLVPVTDDDCSNVRLATEDNKGHTNNPISSLQTPSQVSTAMLANNTQNSKADTFGNLNNEGVQSDRRTGIPFYNETDSKSTKNANNMVESIKQASQTLEESALPVALKPLTTVVLEDTGSESIESTGSEESKRSPDCGDAQVSPSSVVPRQKLRSRSQPPSKLKKKTKSVTRSHELDIPAGKENLDVATNTREDSCTALESKKLMDRPPHNENTDKFNRLLQDAFRKLVMHNSYKKDMKSVVDMIKKDSNLCRYQYNIDHSACSGVIAHDLELPQTQLYPLHVLCALGASPFIIRKVWKAYPPAATKPNDPNALIGSPLHYACLFHTHHQQEYPSKDLSKESISYLEVVQFLVTKNPALLVCSTNKDKRTPLHLACLCFCPSSKHLDLMNPIHGLRRKINPSKSIGCEYNDTDSTSTCSTSSSSSGDRYPLICTPLVSVSNHSQLDSIKCKDAVSLKMNANGNEVLAFLTKMFGRAVNKVDVYGFTPLHLACINSSPSVDVVEHMIRLYPEACLEQSTEGLTPLHIIVSQSLESTEKLELVLKIIKCLLRAKNGHKALSVKDNRGYLPLHACVAQASETTHHLKLLKFLVKKYPDGLNIEENRGHSPRALASSKKLDADCVRVLSPFV